MHADYMQMCAHISLRCTVWNTKGEYMYTVKGLRLLQIRVYVLKRNCLNYVRFKVGKLDRYIFLG
jgi:hypothetical protein